MDEIPPRTKYMGLCELEQAITRREWTYIKRKKLMMPTLY